MDAALSLADLDRNALLASLPLETRERWLPVMERVDLPFGEVLDAPNRHVAYVHFPITAIVSLQGVLEDGAATQVAVAGNDGIAGLIVLMGGGSTTRRTTVLVGGQALRLDARAFRAEFEQPGPAMRILLCYAAALVAQVCQTAVCNRHHSLDQQLCRWLLLSLDRTQGSDLRVTQELIAQMLGVRRAGVNESVLKLQRHGLVDHTRGLISVRDRDGLMRRACECYGVIEEEYERLLPRRRPAA